MTRVLLFVALTVVVLGGCKKVIGNLEQSASETEVKKGKSGGMYGPVDPARKQVSRAELVAALGQIRQCIDAASMRDGTVPTVQATLDVLRREDPKSAELVSGRYVTLHPATHRDEVWAYAKLPEGNYAAATAGGIEIMHETKLFDRIRSNKE